MIDDDDDDDDDAHRTYFKVTLVNMNFCNHTSWSLHKLWKQSGQVMRGIAVCNTTSLNACQATDFKTSMCWIKFVCFASLVSLPKLRAFRSSACRKNLLFLLESLSLSSCSLESWVCWAYIFFCEWRRLSSWARRKLHWILPARQCLGNTSFKAKTGSSLD